MKYKKYSEILGLNKIILLIETVVDVLEPNDHMQSTGPRDYFPNKSLVLRT